MAGRSGADSVDRRTVLAGVAGLVGLAGCTGGGGDTDGSGDAVTGTATPTGTTSAGSDTDGGVKNCPQLPGSFTEFDAGETPLPVDFEYPGAMDEPTYVTDRNWADGNGVVAKLPKGSDETGDGDLHLTLGVRYFARYADGREDWYEDRSGLEEFATTGFDDETVRFLTGETGGPYGGEHNGHLAVALIPFDLSEPDKRGYFKLVTGIEALLYRADASDVSEACGERQKRTLVRVAESVSLNAATTFEQYVDP